jgi:hypothetical protein
MEPIKGADGEQIKVDIDPPGEKANIHITDKHGDGEDLTINTHERIEKINIVENEKGEQIEVVTEDDVIDVTIKDRHHEHPVKIEVRVNQQPVIFHKHQANGAEIKSTAITQGVQIEQDFNLFEKREGEPNKQIADDDVIKLHPHQKFLAVAPDDNSMTP